MGIWHLEYSLRTPCLQLVAAHSQLRRALYHPTHHYSPPPRRDLLTKSLSTLTHRPDEFFFSERGETELFCCTCEGVKGRTLCCDRTYTREIRQQVRGRGTTSVAVARIGVVRGARHGY